MMARQLLAQGNAVFEIGIDSIGRRQRQSRLSLRPVAAYSIMGDADPASWRYSFKQQRPNGDNPLDIDELPARNVSYRGHGACPVHAASRCAMARGFPRW